MHCYLQHLTTGLAFALCCLLATALPANAVTDSDQDGMFHSLTSWRTLMVASWA
jgi:hypothetical protein